jgi:hypothetical protein
MQDGVDHAHDFPAAFAGRLVHRRRIQFLTSLS